MTTEQAFSTDNPDAVAAFRQARADSISFGQRLREDCAKLGGIKAALVRSGFLGSPDEIIGLEPDGDGVIPDGWRIVRERLAPRRGKPGESARQWLADHQPPDVRQVMAGHGLPRHSQVPSGSGGYRMSSPALLEHDGTLWALYNGVPGNILDPDVTCTWTPRKLSEFHAAREAVEEAQAADRLIDEVLSPGETASA